MKKLTDFDRIIGCIKGKAIGGTLGTPHESKMELMNLTYYDPVPNGVLPNDDFDIQLLFLEAVEENNGLVDSKVLARTWFERMTFPFDEYGVATRNYKLGLKPPVTGWFDNPFLNCMGCPIRSEMWAMLAPNKPALAAYFALQDATVDHGVESMAGEVFFSVLESLAFSGDTDFRSLISKALAYIPENCITAQAVRFAVENSGKMVWQELRENLLKHFGHPNFTEAPQNIAFTIIGLLYYPDDFEKALLATTNCGYDTDCTAATIGAIWGCVYGDNFPERWIKPIGGKILASHGVFDMGVPADLIEMSKHVVKVRKLVEKRYARMPEKKIRAMSAELFAKPGKFRLNENTDITAEYNKTPVLIGSQKIALEGSVKSCSAHYPFHASLKGKNLTVSVDKKADFVPLRCKVVVEDKKGALHELSLVTPHEFWLGYPKDASLFAELAKTPVETLVQSKGLAPFTLPDRTLLMGTLPDEPWVHVCGYVHLPVFDKYRFFVSSECPAKSFLDGSPLHDFAEARPCIPAPHRFRAGLFSMDVELKAGWHRWDVFLNKANAIREKKALLVVAHAYTKQLIPCRFYRKPAGVYKY